MVDVYQADPCGRHPEGCRRVGFLAVAGGGWCGGGGGGRRRKDEWLANGSTVKHRMAADIIWSDVFHGERKILVDFNIKNLQQLMVRCWHPRVRSMMAKRSY